MRKYVISIILLLGANTVLGQCISSADFNLTDTACSIQEIVLTDQSVNLESWDWDFNPLDLEVGPSSPSVKFANSDTLLNLRGASLVKDSITQKIFAFAVANSNPKEVVSYELNSTLTDFTASYNFGDITGSVTDGNSSIRFYKKSGFIANTLTDNLVQYYFTSGFDLPPDSLRILPNTALNEFRRPVSVRIVKDNGDIYLIAANSRSGSRYLSILNFGNDITNTPSLVSQINGLNTVNNNSYAVDFDLVRICDNWVLYAVLDNDVFSLLNFGNSLNNTPTITTIPQIDVTDAVSLKIVHDDLGVYAVVLSDNNFIETHRFDTTGMVYDSFLYTNNNVFGPANGAPVCFDILKERSTYLLLGGNRSGNTASRGIHLSQYGNSDLAANSTSNIPLPTSLPFDSPGLKYVRLRGVDSLGNVSIKLDSVLIKDFIPVDFISTDYCIDNPTNFMDLSFSSSLSVNSWSWDFGDGDTSVLQNPSHQYSTNGSFPVQLEIEASNSCISSMYDTVIVSDLRPENPAFDYFPITVCENTLVSFYDSTIVTQDSVTAYFWDFGDGDTSILQNPTHQYALAGNYLVSLVMTGRFGCDTLISKMIAVQAGPSPFLSAEQFCEGSATLFTDSSFTVPGSNIIAWRWDFGDGDTAIVQNPIHTYTSSGQYAVEIEVETDSGCVASNSKLITIEQLPLPNFTYSIPCAQGDVFFTDGGGSDIISREWKNINNPVDSSSSPMFSFPNVGFEEVTLTVVNSSGCKDSITQNIEIFPALTPDFSFENICINDSTQFNDITNSFSVISWDWDLGFFNQSSSMENPKFYYPNPGTYNVSLTIVNAIGCKADTTKTVEIKELPTAMAVVENNCLGSSTLLYNNTLVTGGSVANMSWLVEGESFSMDSLSYVFDNIGDYTVSHEITDNFGCKDDTTFMLSIQELPEVDFTFSPNYGTAPISIQFDNLSTGGVNYYWDFGDNNSSSLDENPNHTYSTNGEYDILLVVENIFGCRDSLVKTIPIIPTELDLELDNLTLQKTTLTDGSITFKPTVLLKNVGSRTIENIDLKASINQETKIVETWTGTLGIGQSVLYQLNSSFLVVNEDLLNYLCLEGFNVNDNTEVNLSNNKLCEIQKGSIQYSKLYPNPSKDIAYLDIVVAQKGSTQVVVYDMIGKEILNLGEFPLEEGFNQVVFDCRNFQSGNYLVKMIFLDEVYSQTLTIRNK